MRKGRALFFELGAMSRKWEGYEGGEGEHKGAKESVVSPCITRVDGGDNNGDALGPLRLHQRVAAVSTQLRDPVAFIPMAEGESNWGCPRGNGWIQKSAPMLCAAVFRTRFRLAGFRWITTLSCMVKTSTHAEANCCASKRTRGGRRSRCTNMLLKKLWCL